MRFRSVVAEVAILVAVAAVFSYGDDVQRGVPASRRQPFGGEQ
jgi:hypothetical protein